MSFEHENRAQVIAIGDPIKRLLCEEGALTVSGGRM
jgi:hypothetical protein